MIPAVSMQRHIVDREERNRQLVASSTAAESCMPQQQARDAATGVPGRKNRPGTSSAKQQKKRIRQAYARYCHLPKEMQDNEYITTGYRVEMGFLDSIKSMFGIHNETGNIWTHLIGLSSLSCCYVIVDQLPTGICLDSRPLTCCLICRLHDVPNSDNCHCICQTSSTGSRLPTPGPSRKSAVHVCTVPLDGCHLSLVKRATIGRPNERLWQVALAAICRRPRSISV